MVAKAVGLNGTQRATKFSDVPASNNLMWMLMLQIQMMHLLS
ncbi:hypothetical protein [Lysinibacillus sphaericus]|nr:hypothetical protein [Lysinibacillus sphaericus]